MGRYGLWLLLTLILAPAADARDPRVVREFKRLQPCPATGKPRGRCPGWVIDHVVPLCAGGADAIENLQWQPRDESINKDVIERRWCRQQKRLGIAY